MLKNNQIEFIPCGHETPVIGTIVGRYRKGPRRGFVVVRWCGTDLCGNPSPYQLTECLPVTNSVIETGIKGRTTRVKG